MNFLKKYWPFILIVFLAMFLRFTKLDKAPSSLYYDEIDLGYQVRSLSETGLDYRGGFSPFYFRSFNTDKTPIPVFLTFLTSHLFQSPEYQVRSSSAIVGVLVVVLAMAILYQLTKSKLASFVAGLVFATSPWLIHFSRLAFEAIFALFFLFIFWSLLNHWLDKKDNFSFWLSAIILGLSAYTYRTMSFLSPVLLIITPIIFLQEFKRVGAQKFIGWILTVLVFLVPFVYATTLGSKDQTRISQISIFSDKMIPIDIQRSREIESGDFQNPGVGRRATLASKIFHNKLLTYYENFRNNILNNFSPDFLFVNGDPNGRHSAKKTGELYAIDVLGLFLGFYYLAQKFKDKKNIFLIIILFLGAVPSNLTSDGASHASRLITFAGPLLVITSLGYFNLLVEIKKNILGKFVIFTLIILWSFSVLQFTNKYFLRFPIENSREFGYGYKESIQKINKISGNYKNIALTGLNDPPMLYYFFWSNTSPTLVQSYGSEYNEGVVKNSPLDKIKPYYPKDLLCKSEIISSLTADTLYMVAYRNLPLDFRSKDKDVVPVGIKLLDIIKYPDNEVAYYLLTRDQKDGKTVQPLKDQKCK